MQKLAEKNELFKELQKKAKEKSLAYDYLLSVLKNLYMTRFLDNKMSILVKQNKGTTFFLSTAGHEMIGSVAALSLTAKKDWGFPYYRDRAFATGIGCDIEEIIAAFLARDVKNHSSGRMMLDHFSHRDLKIPCQSSVVGSQFLHATGRALGVKFDGFDEVVYVSAGDGATSQGDFHEALNFASIHKLPVIFVIQDNHLAISVSSKEQTSGGSIAKMAQGYNDLSIYDIDGTDIEQTTSAMENAIFKARNKLGPSLIVASVPRINSHTCSDDQCKYRKKEEIEEDEKRDPIVKLENYLLEKNLISKEELEKIKDEIKNEVEIAAEKADSRPFPKKETATDKIFKPFIPPVSKSKIISETEIVMMDGLNHALKEEMEKDPCVVVFGEDVADNKGGVFGITRGLTKEFGRSRCFNTPLAESTIVGIAIGLAFDSKYKPVVEIQFADYAWPAMNQIINELSSMYYRSNGQWNCSVVIRMPYGGYIQGGPYHSQSIESIFAHIPGLKIAIPSNSHDAKCLLKTAIIDPNPVIFMEHKALYRQRAYAAKFEPDKDQYLEFGKAKVIEEGEDVTVISWGMMSIFAKEVVSNLKKENLSIEVIDLRTLNPLDMDLIKESVKKTGKVLIVHEAAKTCGFGAELSARISEEVFTDLDAPIVRVCAKDAPIAYCKDLENAILPQKEKLEKEIRKLISY